MEIKEYGHMYDLEKDYWWYKGLHEITVATLEKSTAYNNHPQHILDAGCGTGALLKNLTGRYNEVIGIDNSDKALEYCAKRGLTNALKSSVDQIPYQNETFDAILSNDVLCNLTQEALAGALAEIHRVLKKDGVFIFNVPAYSFLKSSHDRAVHIKQRFTKKEFKKHLAAAGFTQTRTSYRNTFLFLPLALIRLLKKWIHRDDASPESDTKPLARWLNEALTVIIRFENKILNSGVMFPFGLSLYGSVRKD